MALTAIEQLRILAGEARPDATDFKSLILQSAAINGTAFINNAKDTSSDPTAESYYNKYTSIVRSIFSKNMSMVDALERVLVVLLGQNAVTFSQVQSATDAQWEAFVTDKIDDAIELVAMTTSAEKLAYENL